MAAEERNGTVERKRSIDDEDESVRIAVRALGDMRHRALAAQAGGVGSCEWSPFPRLEQLLTTGLLH